MVRCPNCRSTEVVRIVYGLPTEEAEQAALRGEVILGGCIVEPGQPTHRCLECDTELILDPRA
jgi:hypothetical protein